MKRIAALANLPLWLWAAQSISQSSSRAINVGEARINYVVVGTGRPVVLIHGWALSLREWDDQVAALAPEFRVVSYDRRGYGKSSGNADLSADPGDLRLLLDTLGIRSATIVGHSDGADVAYRFMAAFPERVDGLVFYGGPGPQGLPIPPMAPGPQADRAAIARKYGLDSLMRMVGAQPQFLPGPNRKPSTAARLDSIVAAYSGRDLLEDHAQSGRFARPNFEAFKQWRVPMLYLSGEREAPRWLQVSDSLSRWMPNVRRVLIPGGGHGVHLDEPDRFNAALLAFLRETRSGKLEALSSAPVTDARDPEIERLTRLQLKLAAALAPFDSIAIDSLVASDMHAINAGDQVLGKSDIFPALRALSGQLVRVVDDSIAVRRYSDVAIMTLRETVTMRDRSGESTGRLRITEVWMRRNGRWQAMASQATGLK